MPIFLAKFMASSSGVDGHLAMLEATVVANATITTKKRGFFESSSFVGPRL